MGNNITNEKKSKSFLKNIDEHSSRLLITLLVFLVVASVTKPGFFLSFRNFLSIQKQLSGYGLMALGGSVAMISGGIDLSVVYVSNLSAICAGLFMGQYANPASASQQMLIILVAVFIALLIGLVAGALNGFLVTRLNIPPMLATLGTMQLYMGISIVITRGGVVSGIPAAYSNLGRIEFFNLIPLSFIVYVIVALIVSFIMGKTVFGRELYLIGTNEKAARFASIEVDKVVTKAYILSGIIGAIAGLLSLANLGSAKADFGSSYVLLTILIAVLGGINPDGGKGKVYGAFLATLTVQVMSSYLNMFPNLSSFYRDLIWGTALIVVMITNHYLEKRRQAELLRMSQ